MHIGAAKRDKNGIIHPTRADLLMFANYYDILDVYPNYFLDYRDYRNLESKEMRWSARITSTMGDWSGNLYDFFYRVIFKLLEDIAIPFKMDGVLRDDSSSMKKAIREALCNTLSNADYYGELGLVIKQYNDKIVFSNPGILAMSLQQIILGGESKARNRTILNMFSYVNIGERAGSGYPLILEATKENNLPIPKLYDKFQPDVTKLIIYIKNLPVSNENLPVGSKNLPVINKNLPVGNENLPVGNKNLPVGNKNLPVNNKNLPVQQIILDSNLKKPVKERLLKIANELINKTISRQEIIDLLNCSDKTAYNYIKYLVELDLLVEDFGNGKYKFKEIK